MMQYIKITWPNGSQIEMIPEFLCAGMGRDVLCGTDVVTKEKAGVVVKIQQWQWHEASNGHEYEIANTVLTDFTPQFYGVHRVLYEAYDLSVSVGERVPYTMEDYILTILMSPVEIPAVYLIFAWLTCLLAFLHCICEEKKTKVSDFHFKNIGLREDLQLVLIDVENCTYAPTDTSKQRARKGVQDYFQALNDAFVSTTADASW